MKKLIILILLIAGTTFGQGINTGFNFVGISRTITATPFVYDTSALNFLARFTVQPSTDRKILISNIFTMLKDSLGISTLRGKFDFMYFLDYGDSNVAKMNWVKDTMNITSLGLMGWDTAGVTATTGAKLSLNYAPKLASSNMIQKNSHSFGFYSKTSGVFDNSFDLTDGGYIDFRFLIATTYGINFWGNSFTFSHNKTSNGLLAYSRISADSVYFYLDTLINRTKTVSVNANLNNLTFCYSALKKYGLLFGGTTLTQTEIRKILNIYYYWWSHKNATQLFGSTDLYDGKMTLPDTVFMAKNQTYNLYWHNVVYNYSYDKFTYNVTCDSGSVDADKFSITPTSARTTTFKVKVYNSIGQKVDEDSTIFVVKNPITDSAKVFYIGNSLTDTYRYPTTLQTLSNGLVINKKMAISGTEYSFIAGNVSSPLMKDGAVNILAYLSDSIRVPDFITIELGTNDIGRMDAGTLSSKINIAQNKWLDTLLNNILTSLPNVKVGVAYCHMPNYDKSTWIPAGYNIQRKEFTSAYNEALRAKTLQDRIFLIPYHLGINPKTEMGDAIHPNNAGYDMMANYWWGWICGHI